MTKDRVAVGKIESRNELPKLPKFVIAKIEWGKVAATKKILSENTPFKNFSSPEPREIQQLLWIFLVNGILEV